MQTISSALNWWAEDTPDLMAMAFGADRVTYRQLRDWSERVAASLIDAGVERGDRVGVCAANSMEYCVLIHGILRAGAIVSPLNMRYTRHELVELLEDTTPRIVFADEARRALFEGMDYELRALEDVRRHSSGDRICPERAPMPDDPVVIIATSGSTAKPKGVVFTNRTMTSYASGWALEMPHCTKGSKIIVPAPLSTSAGFVQLIHYTTLGCSLYFETVFDPQVFLDILVREQINGFGGVPLFFQRIADLPGFAEADLSSIRVATTGGAPVTHALQEKWMAKGIVLQQIYGQTECGGNATVMPRDLAAKYPEKCGRGGIFTELAIADSEGNFLPPGEIGQILMRGPGTMIGYWNNPEATAETLKDGWLHSGDLGVLDEQGLLTFVDRMKDIIISGGLNISAAEVERAVLAYPGVEEVMVIAAKDKKFGETPMAVLYARSDIDVAALVAHCNDWLADYKVPRYVAIEREPMPRTATGKLAKPMMREKYKDAADSLPRVR
nr:AMP-binding protein [uncultured Hyphomonas sp.]